MTRQEKIYQIQARLAQIEQASDMGSNDPWASFEEEKLEKELEELLNLKDQ